MENSFYDIFKDIKNYDYEIYSYIEKELNRQKNTLELIASENTTSKNILITCGSHLINKYAEGFQNKRFYGGCSYVNEIEQIAIERAKKLFNCSYACVQPHSGTQANTAVFLATCKKNDTILSMDLNFGGHLSHGSKANFSGQFYNIIHYTTDKNGFIDYNEIEHLAKKHKPKLIIAGASAYPRKINFKIFREIADSVNAVLLADIAHIAGLVVTGNHMNPFPYAHVVTATTHKTLRGPRGGIILSTEENNKLFNFNKALFPGVQGGPLMNMIAAKAIAFKEALTPEFKEYQTQIIKNSKALANSLIKKGFNLISNGTDNHLSLIDLTNKNLSGKEMQLRGDSVNITYNKNSIPNDTKSPFVTSGIRLGTPAVTTRGLKENDMKKIADLIYLIATDYEKNKNFILTSVKNICNKYPIYSDY